MRFDFDNNLPVYLQLVEQLELYIISGQFSPGDRLPSVRDLATLAKVNPNTMQRALQELEDKRLIITERTNGKFVTDDHRLIQKRREKLAQQKITNFISKMQAIGFSYREIVEILQNIERKD